MYSGRRLWVGDDQADVVGGGGWMDGQMGSRGVDRSWSQYFLTEKNAISNATFFKG